MPPVHQSRRTKASSRPSGPRPLPPSTPKMKNITGMLPSPPLSVGSIGSPRIYENAHGSMGQEIRHIGQILASEPVPPIRNQNRQKTFRRERAPTLVSLRDGQPSLGRVKIVTIGPNESAASRKSSKSEASTVAWPTLPTTTTSTTGDVRADKDANEDSHIPAYTALFSASLVSKLDHALRIGPPRSRPTNLSKDRSGVGSTRRSPCLPPRSDQRPLNPQVSSGLVPTHRSRNPNELPDRLTGQSSASAEPVVKVASGSDWSQRTEKANSSTNSDFNQPGRITRNQKPRRSVILESSVLNDLVYTSFNEAVFPSDQGFISTPSSPLFPPISHISSTFLPTSDHFPHPVEPSLLNYRRPKPILYSPSSSSALSFSSASTATTLVSQTDLFSDSPESSPLIPVAVIPSHHPPPSRFFPIMPNAQEANGQETSRPSSSYGQIQMLDNTEAPVVASSSTHEPAVVSTAPALDDFWGDRQARPVQPFSFVPEAQKLSLRRASIGHSNSDDQDPIQPIQGSFPGRSRSRQRWNSFSMGQQPDTLAQNGSFSNAIDHTADNASVGSDRPMTSQVQALQDQLAQFISPSRRTSMVDPQPPAKVGALPKEVQVHDSKPESDFIIEHSPMVERVVAPTVVAEAPAPVVEAPVRVVEAAPVTLLASSEPRAPLQATASPKSEAPIQTKAILPEPTPVSPNGGVSAVVAALYGYPHSDPVGPTTAPAHTEEHIDSVSSNKPKPSPIGTSSPPESIPDAIVKAVDGDAERGSVKPDNSSDIIISTVPTQEQVKPSNASQSSIESKLSSSGFWPFAKAKPPSHPNTPPADNSNGSQADPSKAPADPIPITAHIANFFTRKKSNSGSSTPLPAPAPVSVVDNVLSPTSETRENDARVIREALERRFQKAKDDEAERLSVTTPVPKQDSVALSASLLLRSAASTASTKPAYSSYGDWALWETVVRNGPSAVLRPSEEEIAAEEVAAGEMIANEEKAMADKKLKTGEKTVITAESEEEIAYRKHNLASTKAADKKLKAFTRSVARGIPSTIRGVAWTILAGMNDQSDLLETYFYLTTQAGVTFPLLSKSTSTEIVPQTPRPTAYSPLGGYMSADITAKLVQKSREVAVSRVTVDYYADQINKDVGRTSFGNYTDTTPSKNDLGNLCLAYAMFDPEVGYAQGVNYIVMPLLFHLPAPEAFAVLVRLMVHYRMRDLFLADTPATHMHAFQFQRLLASRDTELACHLSYCDVKVTAFTTGWFMSLFCNQFPLQIVCCIYDLLFATGLQQTIHRVGLAILMDNREHILSLTDNSEINKFIRGKTLFDVYVENTPSDRGKLQSSFFGQTTNHDTLIYRGDHLIQSAVAIDIPFPELFMYSRDWTESWLNGEHNVMCQNVALRGRTREAESAAARQLGEMQEMTAKAGQLTEEVQALTSENQKLVDNNEVYEVKIDALTKAINQHDAELEGLREMIETEVHAKIEKEVRDKVTLELQTDLAVISQRTHEMGADNLLLSNQVKELKEAYATESAFADNEIARLKAELEEERSTHNAAMKQHLHDKEKTLIQSEQEKEAMLKASEEKDATLKASEEKRAGLQRSLNELKEVNSNLEGMWDLVHANFMPILEHKKKRLSQFSGPKVDLEQEGAATTTKVDGESSSVAKPALE